MPGLGTSPLGMSPYGVGTPATADTPPTTGNIGSRFLNPYTRDWQIDSVTGQYAQCPPLRARVLRRLLTTLGSSTTLRDLGIKVPDKIGTAFVRQVQDAVRRALRWEIQVEKILRLDSVDVEVFGGGRCRITVSYTDLTTLVADQATVQPRP